MNEKRCSKCGIVKSKSEFHKCASNKDGFYHRCKECRTKYAFEDREKSHVAKKKYSNKRKTDYVMFAKFTWKRIRERCADRTRKHYFMKDFCSCEDFMSWCKSSSSLRSIHDAWVASGNEVKLTPSIDRIDTGKGYTVDNMQWLTYSENSKKRGIDRVKRLCDFHSVDIGKYKVCSYCEKPKLRGEFKKCKKSCDELNNMCKACRINYLDKRRGGPAIGRLLDELFPKGLSKCCMCGEIKEIKYFGKMNGVLNRVRSKCRYCERKSGRERYHAQKLKKS